MKRFLVLLLFLCGALAANAQSTNAPTVNSAATNSVARQSGQALQVQTGEKGLSSITLNELKPNEIAKGRFLYSGISVEVVKKRNPLQLINPLAPAEYGSPEDNVVRDPINGRGTGLKIFAIRF